MRTYWQRLHYKDGKFRYDYMGNAEYEFGSIPRATAALAKLTGFVTKGYPNKIKMDFYPKAKRPQKLAFVGAAARIQAFIEKAEEFKIVENKAGYGEAPVWLPVDPNGYGDEPGFVVINLDYLEEHNMSFQEILDAVIQQFGLSNSEQEVTE